MESSSLLFKQQELMLSVNTAITKFKKLALPRRTTVTIQRRIADLQSALPELRQNDADLQMLATTENKQLPYFKEHQFRTCMDNYDAAIDFLEDAMVSGTPAPSTVIEQAAPVINAPVLHSAVPLPKFEIPTFSGELNEWEEFRDRFSSVVIQDKRLSNSDRMKYLCNALTGSARRAIAHFRITDANFIEAWDTVCNKFQNLREMIAARFDTLHELPIVSAHSLPNMQRLQEVVNSTPRSIAGLGRKVDGWNDLYVDIVLRKFDKEARMLLTDRLSNDRDAITLEQIDHFIDHRIQVIQAGKRVNMNASKSDKNSRGSAAKASHSATTHEVSCPVCSSSHYLYKCFKFKSMTVAERQKLAREKKVCMSCLSGSHKSNQCPSRFRCKRCQQKHHTLLHTQKATTSSVEPSQAPTTPTATESRTVTHTRASLPERTRFAVLLATAQLKIYNPDGRSVIIRALLDQGSEATLLSERIAQTLRIPRQNCPTRITGVGGINCLSKSIAYIGIGSRSSSTACQFTDAYVVSTLTRIQPHRAAQAQYWSHINGLALADPDFTRDQPIDAILGAEMYACLLRGGVRKGLPNEPIAQNTALGWILSGKYEPCTSSSHITVHHALLERLDQSLQQFWQVEDVPTQPLLTVEEQQCEDYYSRTTSRTAEGRYVVRLPFQSTFTGTLGISRPVALRCLNSLERRLDSNVEKRSEYRAFLNEYESLKHMSRVSPLTSSSSVNAYYIPHHAVFRIANGKSKIRVVFNASKRTSLGSSLNDFLHAGPRLQNDLSAILLRWRQHRFVATADIQKMYRQILVHPNDVNYQRVLWRDSTSQPVSEFTLLTVTYGTKAAPFLALRTLRQLAIDEGEAYTEGTAILNDDTYVDDCFFGADSIVAVREKKHQLISLLERGCFPLAKWCANDPHILQDVTPDNTQSNNKEFLLAESIHVLGIQWQPNSDTFHYTVSHAAPSKPTKRSVLSHISKLFDPLGWVAPVVIQAKILIQRLWALQVKWDELLPESILSEWAAFCDQLPSLQSIAIPRWTGWSPDSFKIQIHGFCDASMKAYAAAVYLRIDSDSGTRASLLIAKSKVAPLKALTIPRLELCAAVLLARLVRFSLNHLHQTNVECHCWSDSSVTLAWINSSPARWKMFVANRVSKIQNTLPNAIWHHVSTRDNPADVASRGVSPELLRSEMKWWQGPSWLCDQPHTWPKPLNLPSTVDLEEVNQRKTHVTHVIEPWDLAARYSSWFKLLRVTAYINRFLDNTRKTNARYYTRTLAAHEINRAKVFWLQYIQRDVFAAELSAIKEDRLSPSSRIYSLSPFIDERGLLRVRGRLAHAHWKSKETHPVVVKTHPLLTIMITEVHTLMLHCGPKLLLSFLRREFWILRGRQVVRSILYSCVTCTRYRGTTAQQLMGSLPECRVTSSRRAFEHVGIDYAGPILVRAAKGRGRASEKAYIALFVCMTSKALHLEVVSDYSSAAFLAALKRFSSRRGAPTDIYSDNGTNFVGADQELSTAFRRVVRNDDFLNASVCQGTTWHFIPPSAPHFGGLWEVSVRSVKQLLRRTIKSYTLTFEELSTVLCQVEACINSRPITPVSDNLDDYDGLTPGHLLIGTPLLAIPEPSVLHLNESRLSRWQCVQRIVEQFWARWSREYLHSLHQRSKWHTRNESFFPGRLVLIKKTGQPPGRWELGRITECHPGTDGLVRVVTVTTSKSTFKRPITKLCLLPDDINAHQRAPTGDQN